jgi:hypothetical protein
MTGSPSDPNVTAVDVTITHPSLIATGAPSLLCVAKTGDLSLGADRLGGVHRVLGSLTVSEDRPGRGDFKADVRVRLDHLVGRALCVVPDSLQPSMLSLPLYP